MNLTDVLALVAEHKNERGITHWSKMENNSGLKSYGLGLTQLRKLAKKIGRIVHWHSNAGSQITTM